MTYEIRETVDSHGTRCWYRGDELHRVDGPAVIQVNGYQAWYLNDTIHRDDGPAVIWPDGSKAWYRIGQLHRVGGPATIWADGSEAWYQFGQFHRTDGPAFTDTENPDINDCWYIRGHCIGSAIEFQEMSGLSDEEMSIMVLKYGNIG